MEPRFAAAGCAVITNSSSFRMQHDVPLIIPEVNPTHIKLIDGQSWRKESSGFIVTNSNCSAMGLVLALAPLHQKFGLEKVFAVTMQAVSGAGYPGVASLDILGNVVPFIKKEEEKLQEEVGKLLGRLDDGRVEALDAKVSAHCNRVGVVDGHTEAVSVEFSGKPSKADIRHALESFRGLPQQVMQTELDEFGKLERAGRILHRFRVGDYRVYFERHELGLVVHRILSRHTLKDFLFRSGLKMQEDEALQQNPKFWELIEAATRKTGKDRWSGGLD